MNVVKEIERINEQELKRGIYGGQPGSWHHRYKDSAWVFIGGMSHELSEGDVICFMSQWGEIEDINLCRDKSTNKSLGFAFVKYEDQRSTILAVDNFNGMTLNKRILRCDHVEQYKLSKAVRDKESAMLDANPSAQVDVGPGHVYKETELANSFNIENGVNVWAAPASSSSSSSKFLAYETKEDTRHSSIEKVKNGTEDVNEGTEDVKRGKKETKEKLKKEKKEKKEKKDKKDKKEAKKDIVKSGTIDDTIETSNDSNSIPRKRQKIIDDELGDSSDRGRMLNVNSNPELSAPMTQLSSDVASIYSSGTLKRAPSNPITGDAVASWRGNRDPHMQDVGLKQKSSSSRQNMGNLESYGGLNRLR